MGYRFTVNSASFSQIREHLARCNNSFMPPLELKVNLDEYSKKIFNIPKNKEFFKDKYKYYDDNKINLLKYKKFFIFNVLGYLKKLKITFSKIKKENKYIKKLNYIIFIKNKNKKKISLFLNTNKKHIKYSTTTLKLKNFFKLYNRVRLFKLYNLNFKYQSKFKIKKKILRVKVGKLYIKHKENFYLSTQLVKNKYFT